MDGPQSAFLRSHEQIGGVYFIFVETSYTMSWNRVYLFDGINFVIPEHNAQQVISIGKIDIDGISFNTEIASVQLYIIAYIQAIYQSAQKNISVQQLSFFDVYNVIIKIGRISHTVDTRYGWHDDDIVSSGKQGRCSSQS